MNSRVEIRGEPLPFKRLASPALGKMLQPDATPTAGLQVPYLKAGHVQWQGVELLEELPLMWASEAEVADLSPRGGDLLICEGGEVGRAALAPAGLPENTIIQNSLHLVRETELASTRYLKYALEHVAASGWIELVCNKATIAHLTDPNIVHELMTKLNKAGVYYWTEVEQFAQAFFNPKIKTQAALHQVLKPAFDRYQALQEEPRDLFRKDLGSFLRLYEFLSQIIPYDDPELEKLFVFGKNLMPRIIADGKDRHRVELDSDVMLTHYRLQKVSEQQLDLAKGEVVKLPGIVEAGTGAAPEDEKKALREIVAKMNDLFAGHITEADFIGVVTTWQGHLARNEKLAAQARNNSEEQFAMGDFKDAFTDIVIEAQDAHNQIAAQLLKDERIFGVMQRMMAKVVWQKFQRPGA